MSIFRQILLRYTGLVAESYKRKPNSKCVICDNLVYRRPKMLEQTQGRAFCGNACYGMYCRNETPCMVCGKMILASLHKKTCSRSCANAHRTGIKYKLGQPLKDKVKAQRSLKLRLLDARGKKCERCEYDKYEILQIHHKDRNRNNNDLSNLQLICPNCHYEEHLLEKSWLNNFSKK